MLRATRALLYSLEVLVLPRGVLVVVPSPLTQTLINSDLLVVDGVGRPVSVLQIVENPVNLVVFDEGTLAAGHVASLILNVAVTVASELFSARFIHDDHGVG